MLRAPQTYVWGWVGAMEVSTPQLVRSPLPCRSVSKKKLWEMLFWTTVLTLLIEALILTLDLLREFLSAFIVLSLFLTPFSIFMGLRYCYRRRRNPHFYEQQEMAFRQHYRANIRASRKKKPKLMTLDQVDALFPVQTYKEALLILPTRSTESSDKDAIIAVEDTEEKLVTEHNDSTFEKSPVIESQPVPPTDDDEDERGTPLDVVPEQPDNVCAICIEEIQDQQKVRLLTCGHIFHTECVDPWLTTRRAYCPLCKYDYYVPPPVEESEENSEVNAEEPQRPARAISRRTVLANIFGIRRGSFSARSPAQRRSSEQSTRPAHLEVVT